MTYENASAHDADPTPGPLRAYPSLTGLRGIAAAWVFVYHAWVLADPRLMLLPFGTGELDLTMLFSCGWAGVDVFFCLSAFLLALPFAHANATGAAHGRIRDYLTRRCLRILPAYYAQLALLLLATGYLEHRLALPPSALLAHLGLWLNLGSAPVQPLVGVWWTLPIEFSFYLLLPFLVPLLTPRRALWLTIVAIATTLAYRHGMFAYASARGIGDKVVLLEQLPGRLDQFMLGAFAAVMVGHRRDLGRQLPRAAAALLAIAGVGIIVLMVTLVHWYSMVYWEGHPLLYVSHFGLSLGIVALILAACSDRSPDLRVLRSRPLVFLGTVSFSFYLWHQLILMWLARQPWLDALGPYPLPALLFVGGALALVVAWISWRLIETPFLKLGRSAFRIA